MIDLKGSPPDLSGLVGELRQQIAELSDRCAVRSAELGIARHTVTALQAELDAVREQLKAAHEAMDSPAVDGAKSKPRRNGAAMADA